MIWRRTATDHLAAIGSFPRQWLGGSLLDRLIPVTIVGWFWCFAVGFVGLLSADFNIFFVCVFILGPIPWGLWLLDAFMDGSQVKQDTATFLAEGAILATRCEYLGGHPQLPHGRFAYLLLEGTKQNPSLTIIFPTVPQPGSLPTNAERFILPILDLGKMKHENGSDASPAADLITAINSSAGRMLRPEQLTFVVDYDGAGGRKHKVEFTNFFHGNNEIRNWQNHLVCAQAQADTGIEPHAPWVTLRDDPNAVLANTQELELSDAFSRNGHEEREASSAFSRR